MLKHSNNASTNLNIATNPHPHRFRNGHSNSFNNSNANNSSSSNSIISSNRVHPLNSSFNSNSVNKFSNNQDILSNNNNNKNGHRSSSLPLKIMLKGGNNINNRTRNDTNQIDKKIIRSWSGNSSSSLLSKCIDRLHSSNLNNASIYLTYKYNQLSLSEHFLNLLQIQEENQQLGNSFLYDKKPSLDRSQPINHDHDHDHDRRLITIDLNLISNDLNCKYLDLNEKKLLTQSAQIKNNDSINENHHLQENTWSCKNNNKINTNDESNNDNQQLSQQFSSNNLMALEEENKENDFSNKHKDPNNNSNNSNDKNLQILVSSNLEEKKQIEQEPPETILNEKQTSPATESSNELIENEQDQDTQSFRSCSINTSNESLKTNCSSMSASSSGIFSGSNSSSSIENETTLTSIDTIDISTDELAKSTDVTSTSTSTETETEATSTSTEQFISSPTSSFTSSDAADAAEPFKIASSDESQLNSTLNDSITILDDNKSSCSVEAPSSVESAVSSSSSSSLSSSSTSSNQNFNNYVDDEETCRYLNEFSNSYDEEMEYRKFLPKKSCLSSKSKLYIDSLNANGNATSSPLMPSSPVNSPTNLSSIWSSSSSSSSNISNNNNNSESNSPTQSCSSLSFSSSSNSNHQQQQQQQQQQQKKRVLFADSCGKDLFTVRTMSEPSNCPPKLTSKIVQYFLNREFDIGGGNGSKCLTRVNSNEYNYVSSIHNNTDIKEAQINSRDSFFSSARNYDYGISGFDYSNDAKHLSGSIAFYSLNFVQPSSDYAKFRQKLNDNCVSLENVLLNSFKINGTIKCKNINFHKHVFVRCSFNNWTSYEDFQTQFVSYDFYSSPNTPSSLFYGNGSYSSDHRDYDTFRFEFQLPKTVNPLPNGYNGNKGDKKDVTASIQFCICYKSGQGNDQKEFWDSNDGKNYEILQYVIDIEHVKPSNINNVASHKQSANNSSKFKFDAVNNYANKSSTRSNNYNNYNSFSQEVYY